MSKSILENKKGQASGAAVLVIVIGVLIIFYILFLPPSDRADILNGESSDEDDDNSDVINYVGKVLVDESPKRLDTIEHSYFYHDISPFSLFSKTESGLIMEIDELIASRTVFNSNEYSFDFNIYDKKMMHNFILSFVNKEGSGNLMIYLNDKLIMNKFLSKINPTPIKLPKEFLEDGKNIIRFKVSSPGIMFFLKNSYTLSNVKLYADTTDDTGLTSSHHFMVEESEYENLEKASMTFFVECLNSKKGILKIKLNGFNIYGAGADCGNYVKNDINPTYFKSGENILEFSANTGSYIIDSFKIRTDLDEIIYPVYYFKVSEEAYKLIEDEDLYVNTSLEFVKKDEDYNQADIDINGRITSVDILDDYSLDITNDVKQGNNYIRVKPTQGTVDIVNLKVFYHDED